MTARGGALVVGLVLVTGCVGHLEFDPNADAGSITPGNNNSNNSNVTNNNGGGNNNGSVGNNTGNGSGGWAGSGGTTGTGGQAPAAGSGGATGSGGAAMADAGVTPYPMPDAGGGGGAFADGGSVSASGCPSSINVLTDVFAAKCGGCHGATAPTKNLDLVSTGLGARMVTKISTCKGEPLIAGTLTNSKPTGLLFEKLAGKVTDCGVQMPAGATPLSAAEMACVSDWAVAAIAKITGK